LVKTYEEDEEECNNTSSNNNKSNKTSRLMDLMQQIQEFGQPPAEIVNEIAPGLQLDEDGLPKMDNNGGLPPLFGAGGEGGEEDCRIM
jgi:peroxin-19